AKRPTQRTTGYSREEMYGREFWREMTQASEHSSDIAIKGAPQAVELQKGDVQSQASQDQVSQNQVFQNSHFPNPEFHDVNFISQDFQNQDFQNRRYEVKFVTKVGEERWLDVMTAPMPFEGAAATLAVAMDITGRKEV